MRRLSTCLLGLAVALGAPATAAAGYGGGGVFGDAVYVPQPRGDSGEMGAMGCFGGTGFGVSARGFRAGGEGRLCGGEGIGAWSGGAQLGAQKTWRRLYANAYSGVGLGWMGEKFEDDLRRDSTYVYLRPTVGMGLMLGAAAIEAGLYLDVPINLVQRVEEGMDARPVVSANPGLRVSVLFGGFRAKSDRHDEKRPRG